MSKHILLLLVLSTIGASAGQVMLKLGAHGKINFIEFVNWQIFCGLALYGLSTTIWIYALSRENLVDVFAFTALTFVFVYFTVTVHGPARRDSDLWF